MFNRFLESLYQIRKALSVRLGQERSKKSERKNGIKMPVINLKEFKRLHAIPSFFPEFNKDFITNENETFTSIICRLFIKM